MEKKFYYPDKIKTHVAAETEAPDTESIQSFDQIIEEEEQSFPQKEQDQPEIDEEDTPANDLALVPSYNNRSITTPEQKSILRGVAGEYLKLVKTIERQIQVASPKPGLSVAAEQCCELARRMKFNEKEKESSMKLSFVELFRRRVQYDRMGVPLSVNEVIYLDDYEREWRHMESILSDSDQYIDDNQPDSSKQAEAIMELGYSSNSVDNDTRPIQTQTHQRKLRPNRQHGHENDRDLFGNESCGCICPNTQRASGGSELAMGGYAERFDLPQNRACGAYQTYSGAPTKPEKHKLYDYTGTNFSPQFHGGRRRQKPGSQENINLSLYPENSNPYEYDRNILLEDGRHLHVHEAHACAPKFDEKKYLDEYEKQLSNEHKERSHNSKVADSSRSHKNDRQHSTGKHRKEYEDARHPTQFPQNTPNSRREYDRQIVMENRPQAHNYFETSNVSEVPNSAPQYPDEYYPLNQNRQTMDQQQQRLPDYVDERNASTYYNRHHVGRQEKQLKKEQRNQMKPQEKGQSESGDRLHHQRSLHCSERRNSSGLYDSKQSERIYKDLSEEKEHQLSQYVEAKYSAECQRNPNEVSKDQAMELNCNASRSHRRQYCGQSEKEKPEYEKCLLGKEHPPVDGLQGSYIARHLERASVQPPIERQLANAWTESEPVSFKNRRHCNDEHCSAKHTTDNKEIQSYRVEEDRTKPHISYQSSRPNLYDQPACLCQSPVFTHQSPQRHRKDSNRSLSAIEKPTPVPSRAASPSSSTHSDVPSDYRDCLVYAKKRTIPLSRSPSTDQPWMTMERSPVAPTTCQESAAQPDKGMPLSYSCTPCPCAERQVKQNQQQHVPQNKQMWQMTCGVNRQSLPSHICELCRQRSSSMVGSLYQNHSSPIANIQISHRNHPPPPSCPVHPSHPNCSAGIAYRSSRSSPLECKKCQLQISPPKCCCMPHPSWPLTMIPPSTPCGCGTSKLSDCNCDGNNYRNRSNHVKDMNRFRKEVVAHSLLVEGHALPPPRLHESPDQALASSSRRTGHARIKAGEVKCKYETEEGKQQNKLPPYELHSVEAMSRIATEKRQHQHCRFKDLVSEECFDSQSDSQSEQGSKSFGHRCWAVALKRGQINRGRKRATARAQQKEPTRDEVRASQREARKKTAQVIPLATKSRRY
ncbi:uncharacterized protein LOC115627491 isoform X2 [Scaptodrosophila lebanonensis]|uniref:Uncharacterized protein LOC115627491 isoform X2 n=1 Tax=Drosophila lebanonensis TaxID=7225 RepID=A0A6J2TV56_DROLE|nr:uncharacterized protein LOC115627491 isoform X2 [Scaptodrosophila lebanonensis]